LQPFSETGGRIRVVFGETLWRYLSELTRHVELLQIVLGVPCV
jgi:hypothetical protein